MGRAKPGRRLRPSPREERRLRARLQEEGKWGHPKPKREQAEDSGPEADQHPGVCRQEARCRKQTSSSDDHGTHSDRNTKSGGHVPGMHDLVSASYSSSCLNVYKGKAFCLIC